MQGFGIVLGAFVLLLFLSFQADEGGFFRSVIPTATSTNAVSERSVDGQSETIASPPRERLTEQEIERRIQQFYRELDTLSDELRAARLREPTSPYAGTVSLRTGNARNKEVTREYLILQAEHTNTSPVNISDWYVESYVTKERAALPQGARVLESFRSRRDSDITLLPGERAYLLTIETPLNVSFHENACTGYLRDRYDFYPSLRLQCSYPRDEIEDSDVKLDDDVCYDYVESLGLCEHVSESDIEDIDGLTGRCERFLENTFNYNSCVAVHQHEPFFDDVGDWRIYLGRNEELWRSEREIIRLIDENDRVVDVLEY